MNDDGGFEDDTQTTVSATPGHHKPEAATDHNVSHRVDCLTIFSITFYEFYGILQQSLVLVWNNFLNLQQQHQNVQSTPSSKRIYTNRPFALLFKTRCDKYTHIKPSSIIQRNIEMWKYLAIVILWASIQCHNDPLTNSFGCECARQPMNIIKLRAEELFECSSASTATYIMHGHIPISMKYYHWGGCACACFFKSVALDFMIRAILPPDSIVYPCYFEIFSNNVAKYITIIY